MTQRRPLVIVSGIPQELPTGDTVYGATGGASVTISATAPATPTAGDLWWDTESGAMFVYYSDGDTSQWVSASNTGGSSVAVSATAPATPIVGELWWDTESGSMYVYYNDGGTSQWVSAANAGPVGPQGAQGAAGPNAVSTSTTSSITGLIKGAAGVLAQATAGTDYVDVSGGTHSSLHLQVVAALPGSPNADTIYLVTG